MKAIVASYYDHADPVTAAPMAKYMRNQFPFLGLKRPLRQKLNKTFLQASKVAGNIDWAFVWDCYGREERELQYLALDYLQTLKGALLPADFSQLTRLITTKSWWDTVDACSNLTGQLLRTYPGEAKEVLLGWSVQPDLWLRRSSMIAQLHFKTETDTDLLAAVILPNRHSGEFFLDKAIGWILRDFSKTNPRWVETFLQNHDFARLTVREASKYLPKR